MKYDPPYWFWDSVVPGSVCESIVEFGKSFQSEIATVGYREQGRVDPNIRQSKVTFLEGIHWINGITNQYCALANSSAWNFEISGQQSPQFTIYRPGEFYDFHTDASVLESTMRKLSVSINLSDPNAYEGGEFEMNVGDGPFFLEEMSRQGTIIVFPSDTEHRVKPVTKGIRYSLVNWFEGPAFR